MKAWLDSLEPRERWLIYAAVAVFILTMSYTQFWEPANKDNARLKTQLAAEQETAAYLSAIAPQVAKNKGKGQKRVQDANRNVLSIINQTGKSKGLGDAFSKIQPDGNDKARVWLENAAFTPTMQWLNELESRYNISATSSNIERGKDSGTVQARLTLERK